MFYIEESGDIPENIFNELKSRKMPSTSNKKEELARKMYDNYCESVGGKAFNGDQLPGSMGFFNDPSKQKQADAWRIVAETGIQYVIDQLR